MLYSGQTGGFYDREIHGDNIPADAVEITDTQYRALLDGQETGKIIVANNKGKPVLADPPALSQQELDEQKKKEELAWRDDMLRQVINGLDQIRNDTEFGSITYKGQYTAAQLNQARVLLCDYLDQPDFPWGTRPSL